jgi:hypothetical protein
MEQASDGRLLHKRHLFGGRFPTRLRSEPAKLVPAWVGHNAACIAFSVVRSKDARLNGFLRTKGSDRSDIGSA